jgi:1-aminocyclopropane-1-carboxylate deaminase
MKLSLSIGKPFIEQVQFNHKIHTTVDVLRLDTIHPVISGNKWYKLRYYLEEAILQNKKAVLTFGGAFSNHIVATAAACQAYGLQSIGIIRGEQPEQPSHTLQLANELGMHLVYLSRTLYKQKLIPEDAFKNQGKKDTYIINEGGYGLLGSIGAMRILEECDARNYSHIVAAVGTATTLAGLTRSALPHQKIIGISVLKNNFSIGEEAEKLIPNEKKECYSIIHDYHFGGYAKANPELFLFMNQFFDETTIPTDFVYTGKLFYAVEHLIKQNYFPRGANILVIHSGGLQGNASLPNGKLIF